MGGQSNDLDEGSHDGGNGLMVRYMDDEDPQNLSYMDIAASTGL